MQNIMALVGLSCPHCGGSVQLEENMKQGFCMYCGTKVVNDRFISGEVSIDKSADIINHIKLTKDALIAHDWDASTRFVEKILLMDPECSDAWYMKALISKRQASAEAVSSFISKGEGAKNKFDLFSKEDITAFWGKYTIKVIAKEGAMKVPRTIIVTLDDGKESIKINIGQEINFGVDGGSHSLFVRTDEGPPALLATNVRKSFTVENDVSFEFMTTYGGWQLSLVGSNNNIPQEIKQKGFFRKHG